MRRRLALACIIAALMQIHGPASLAEDAYPSKTIIITSHSAPGGGTDIMGRTLIEALKAQKVNAVIENRPGGSGAVNLAYLHSRKGDGYTLGTASRSHIIARYIANLPLAFSDFKPVAKVATVEYVIVTNKRSGWNTIADAIAALKANPSTKLGGGFIGTSDSLIAFGLFKALGLKPAYVPYEDAAAISVALLGDQLQLAIVNPPEARAQIENGDFKVLAVASEKRSPFFPDAPTLRESGIDVVGEQWLGVWAPPDTPDEIVAKAAAIIRTAIKEPVFQSYLKDGMLAEAYAGPAEFEASMQQDDRQISQMIKELNLVGSEAK
jgi:tripartite-type tricarboxylate transporter receptor subunit TctC